MKTNDRSLYYKTSLKNDSIENDDTKDDTIPDVTVAFENEQNEISSKDYCAVVKKVKKDNITKDNIGEIMLCQIPGISYQTARAVLNKFKNIKDLIKAIEEDKNCLKDVYTTDNKNKTRKVSKKSIENIIHFLLLS